MLIETSRSNTPMFDPLVAPSMVIVRTRCKGGVSKGNVLDVKVGILKPEISINGLREYRISFADLHQNHNTTVRTYQVKSAVEVDVEEDMWIECTTYFRLTVFKPEFKEPPHLEVLPLPKLDVTSFNLELIQQNPILMIPLRDFDPWCRDQTPLQKGKAKGKKVPTLWDRINNTEDFDL